MICQHCARDIEPTTLASPSGYIHTTTRRIVCFDIYKPEVATPLENDGYEPSGLDEFARKA